MSSFCQKKAQPKTFGKNVLRLVNGNIVSVSLYGDIFDTLKGHHVVTMFKDIKVKLLIH